MSNLIVVESQNDKFFIEQLILVLEVSNIQVDNIEYECLSGLGKLKNKIKDIHFHKYEKIGFILDADNDGTEKRITLVNEYLKEVCNDVTLTSINELVKSPELDVEFAIYIAGIDDSGELETILKYIATQNSDYADCLVSWRKCLSQKDKIISDKDFNKFWVNNYIRFDTCT